MTIIATYKTTGSTVHVHAVGCAMLNTINVRKGIVGLTMADVESARDENGFKIVYCKCTKKGAL